MIDVVPGAAGFVLLDAVGNAQLHGELLLGPGRADEVGVEIFHVLLQLFRAVPFRVDRHEQDLVGESCVAVGPAEFLVKQLQAVQGARADVGTVGIADQNPRRLSREKCSPRSSIKAKSAMTRGSGSNIKDASDGCGGPCITFQSDMPPAALIRPTNMARAISRKLLFFEFNSVIETLYFDG